KHTSARGSVNARSPSSGLLTFGRFFRASRGSGLGIRENASMTDRRDFIRALGVAVLGQALPPLAPSPSPRAPFHQLDRLGLALYTVRDVMKNDVDARIARVAATGDTEVEFAG